MPGVFARHDLFYPSVTCRRCSSVMTSSFDAGAVAATSFPFAHAQKVAKAMKHQRTIIRPLNFVEACFTQKKFGVKKFLSTHDSMKHPEMHKKVKVGNIFWRWKNILDENKNWGKTFENFDRQTDDITEWQVELLLASSKARLKNENACRNGKIVRRHWLSFEFYICFVESNLEVVKFKQIIQRHWSEWMTKTFKLFWLIHR